MGTGPTHVYTTFRELGSDRGFQSIAELCEDRVVPEVPLIEERTRNDTKLVTNQPKQRLAGENDDSFLHGGPGDIRFFGEQRGRGYLTVAANLNGFIMNK
jgi:hypothetical protein